MLARLNPSVASLKYQFTPAVFITLRVDVSFSLQATPHVSSEHLMTQWDNVLLFVISFFVLVTCLLNNWLILEGEIKFWPVLGIKEFVWIYSIFGNGFQWLALVSRSTASCFWILRCQWKRNWNKNQESLGQ